MRNKSDPNQLYPRELLGEVVWSFVGEPFASRAAFVEAVREYQLEILQQDTWRPDAVVLRCPRVRVQHEYGDEPDYERAELTADDGVAFTAGELLFKIHNAFVGQLGDHHFFEGLSLSEETGAARVPVYDVDLGS
jgi:hypothetical protein